MITLKLYGRDYCSLCVQMREQLAALADGRFLLQWIDIEDDEMLESRYGEWVPVLTDQNDIEICHYHLDAQALRARLADLG